MQEVTRRKTILGALGAGAVALAGCVSEDGESDDGTDDTGNGGADGDDTVIEASSLEQLDSNCGGPESETVHVAVAEQTVTVDGVSSTPTPCYDAELAETAIEDGTLTLVVDTTVETDDDGEPVECIECVGEVTYVATVDLTDDTTVDQVVVEHEDETHTVDEDEFDEERPEIVDSEIETIRPDIRESDDEEYTDVDIGEATVTIEGAIETSTPHYQAVLDTIAIQVRTLTVDVAVESTQEDDEMVTPTTGIVEYELTVEVPNPDALEAVEIDHPDATHGHAWDSASESDVDDGGEETAASDGTRTGSSYSDN